VRALCLLAVVVALGACACGAPPSTYHLDKTRSCLEQKGATIDRHVDFVASTATGGAFVAHLRRNFLTVAFGDNEDDAIKVQDGYQRFAGANVKAGLPDILRRTHNAVMLWHEHPSDADLSLVQNCLR
jgi:hypothetical protein